MPSKVLSSLLIALAVLLLSSCGQLKSANHLVQSIDKRISPDYDGPPEKPYCSGTSVFSGATVTINGTAHFEYRPLIYTSSFRGLGHVLKDYQDNDIEPNPIRHAEVVILDEDDNVVQCGETDGEGEFALTLPKDGQLYRVRIHSRGFNDNHVRASVLRSPESNFIYYLQEVVLSNQDYNLNFLAKATGTLEAGAFFIFDQILSYNETLRSRVGTCSGFPTGCTPFTVAPKVAVYWEKGFNPGVYLGSGPTSFYYMGTNRLFILGGESGDVDFSDTDHFDKSIIAHEYFHFLEGSMGKSSSPGGSHNGNEVIDPRLAWSEGAAQFFQGVMTSSNRVLDSRGNLSGSTNLIVDYSIENVDTDQPVNPQEGEYREFSVARLLWDAEDTTNESSSSTPCDATNIDYVHDKCASDGFAYFWAAFSGNNGIKNSNYGFVSSSLLQQLHNQNYNSAPASSKNWRPLRVYESQVHKRGPDSNGSPAFGTRLQSCGTAQVFSMHPPFDQRPNRLWYNTHTSINNDFLHYTHSGGPLRIDLTVNLVGVSVSMYFIIYKKDFFIGDNSTVLGYDSSPNVTENGSKLTYSVFTTESVPAGDYMLNANIIQHSGNGHLTYSLTENGGNALCSAD